MPRKTAGKQPNVQADSDCFNEAAARCRGKPAARPAAVVPSRKELQ